MQFIVFAAFAIVLSIPPGGPPWRTLQSPEGVWAVVLGSVALTTAVAAGFTAMVKRKLEREPAWLTGAQRRLAQGNTAVRVTLVVGLMGVLYGTSWSRIVRGWVFQLPDKRELAVARIWGLDEILMLAPFLAGVVLSLVALYPADRAIRQVSLELRLWAAVPAHPVWRLRKFLSFQLRQNVLIILVPMVPIVIANDFALAYSEQIRSATGLLWADQAVLALVAGVIFFFAPVMLRYIWHTRPLPPSDLRGRLEELCRRIGLTYRRILIWESDGMVVNAAVMGLLRPVRYIMLSDGLLEMMDDRRIEAVFGHEAGHVKKRHIEFYMLFAIASMLIVGGVAELVLVFVRHRPELMPYWQVIQDYLQVGAMGLIILVWGLGFGAVSRRFEWQADLFGARSVTPPAQECTRSCLVHGTAAPAPAWVASESEALPALMAAAVARGAVPPPPDRHAVCATAAHLFAESLERIAVLNGIPLEAWSWRHSSIANRMRLLTAYATDPSRCAALERGVAIIKTILLVGTGIGLGVAVWLYWPQR